MSKVIEAARVSKEVVIKDEDYYSYFYAKPVSDTRGSEECSPEQINLEEKQITKLSYDVAPSNISMLESKSFGSRNKINITKESMLIKKG